MFVALSEAYFELWEGENLPGEVVDCRDVEGTAGYLDSAAAGEITRRLEPRGKGEQEIRFIDSGDYHHLSYLRGMAVGMPYSLVLFDHHPDMQPAAFGGVLSCGGWVRSLLEDDAFLKEVVIIGVNPDLTGETAGFGDRVRVFARMSGPEGGEYTAAQEELSSLGWPALVSIDKDVLQRDYARTDWDQGNMSLGCLQVLLETVFRTVPVLGADVCGEWTSSRGAGPEDRRINKETDIRLKNILEILWSLEKS